MNYFTESLHLHDQLHGKLSVQPKMHIKTKTDLALAYTPGVAAPCLEIQKNPKLGYHLTGRGNSIAVITDGSAVLGLGDIGPEAAMPVMEGKCLLFKEFADIDAIPLCIRTKDVTAFTETVALLAGNFAGINLEDISAPRCFEIEKILKEKCDIPVFHDDQHGTAVVVLAALINACRLTGKILSAQKVVICGAGAAGIAIMKLLQKAGIHHIVMCDIGGILHPDCTNLNPATLEAANMTNPCGLQGSLSDALKNADVFIGVSAPDLLNEEMVRSMNPDPFIFALANPCPEIMPDIAKKAGAAIVGTGRSDFPNQINNLLAFPGIFRGTLNARACDITDEMKLAASHALADLITSDQLCASCILPSPLDVRVAPAVAHAVEMAAGQNNSKRPG
ncbi:MAG: NADP-dependent malic enzyme [Lachnospiraceae bacterium]|nr:NADP-dependent malic enzyme [Lachnospiraceae bacterium]